MVRRRRTPITPHFRIPPPFNPLTGQFAALGQTPDLTRVAMMQVSEEDTHDNYVVCRGYDPETKRFYNEVLVAKPYGQRGTGKSYQVGEIYAAVKAHTRLGDNSGKAAESTGHPEDLDEEVEILKDDDNEKPIAWLLLDSAEGDLRFELTATFEHGGTAIADVIGGEISFSIAPQLDEALQPAETHS